MGGWADSHLSGEALEGQSTRARGFPTSEERIRLRRELLSEARASLPGTLAGTYSGEFAASARKEVPWQHLLAQFVSGLRRSDFRTYPFNRKHIWRNLYLPSIGVPGPEHLVLCLDTSGSITDKMLTHFLSELHNLRVQTECALTVLQFDAEVQDISRFEAFQEIPVRYRICGRGGTDIRKPFSWLEERQVREGLSADAIIVLTDGYGPFPLQAPLLPVLWVLTKDGIRDVPFGSVVRLV